MAAGEVPDMFILEALANDADTVVAILEFLNRDPRFGWHREWGRPFVREDVVRALMRLVRDDSARAHVGSPNGAEWVELPARQLPASSYDDARFTITPRGRLRNANWET